MSQFVANQRLAEACAYGKPDQSAGPDGLVVRRGLAEAWAARLQPAFFQPAVSLQYHPLTREVAADLDSLPPEQSRAIRSIFEDIIRSIASYDTSNTPVLRMARVEDDSVIVEWVFPDRRLGFTIEPNTQESGWYFVYSRGSSERYEAGTMDQLNLVRLVKAVLQE